MASVDADRRLRTRTQCPNGGYLHEILLSETCAHFCRVHGAPIMTDPVQSIIRLIYLSQATVPVDERVLDAIVQAARHRNRADGIDGALLYRGGYFLQLVEGAPSPVVELLERLRCDQRHRIIRPLWRRPVAQRLFPGRSMLLCRAPRSTSGSRLPLTTITSPQVAERVLLATCPRANGS